MLGPPDAAQGGLPVGGRQRFLPVGVVAGEQGDVGDGEVEALRAVALADQSDESVSVAVPDGDGVRFVAQATRRRAMAISFRTGDLLPAERCAPGALFAADRDETEWERWRSRRRTDPLDRGCRCATRRGPWSARSAWSATPAATTPLPSSPRPCRRCAPPCCTTGRRAVSTMRLAGAPAPWPGL
ncbi:hypothetical protein ACFYY1_27815 [Streptomyces sp. NPDC001890]|uniref:hypothetical protein n=1 Tax=Streptomyces sp. NPDC001890 TaxID=3364620 RepID=UPI0036B9B1FB